MRIKRALMMAVLAVAIAALAVPLVGMKARAAAGTAAITPRPVASAPLAPPPAAFQQEFGNGQRATVPQTGEASQVEPSPLPENVRQIFFPNGKKAKGKVTAQHVGPTGGFEPQVGLPLNMSGLSAFSAGIMTTQGGRDTQFSEVSLLGDWDGREDCTADHSQKVDDFSGVEIEPDV
ncbi:MAG TPA: hypothetical protein VKM94_18640, partial [Blastocatellia bacterium]|nr:hypothetical protein [Blastocatellia bacterium]